MMPNGVSIDEIYHGMGGSARRVLMIKTVDRAILTLGNSVTTGPYAKDDILQMG